MEDAGGVAPTVRDGWLAWEVKGKPVSVRLSLDVVSRLGLAVQEGFKALRRRGLETGGLLIGTKRVAGNQIVVDIDDFEPIESEHANGPSYLLSDADYRTLKERIAAREAAATSTSVVGFYRSHTRCDFAITVEDSSLFSTYFRKPSDVFLLIKSNDGGPPTAGFIIREGGEILSESPYAQFPLDWTMGIPAAREIPAPALPTPPAPRPPARIVPPPSPPRTNRRVMWPMWLATAAAVALAVGLPFGPLRPIPGSIPATPVRSLALSVTTAGNSLRVSWDHQASSHAGHAVLWIQDGQEEKRFELDSKQLSDGSVAYWPTNSDVTFRFELLSGGAKVTESVRSIGGPSKAAVVLPAPAAVAVEAPAAPTAPAVKAPRASVSALQQSHRNRTESASQQLSRTFAMPRPVADRAVGAPASLPDPPTIQTAVAPALEHSKEFLKTIQPSTGLDGAEPAFRVRVEPVSHLARSIPLIGKRSQRADYVPPAPLRNPGLASPPHRDVSRDVNIDVKVYVNPSGKVDYSEVLSKVAGTDRDLAALAVFSARRWEFVPARAGDGTVPGEVILHYQFGPGARQAGNQAVATR